VCLRSSGPNLTFSLRWLPENKFNKQSKNGPPLKYEEYCEQNHFTSHFRLNTEPLSCRGTRAKVHAFLAVAPVNDNHESKNGEQHIKHNRSKQCPYLPSWPEHGILEVINSAVLKRVRKYCASVCYEDWRYYRWYESAIDDENFDNPFWRELLWAGVCSISSEEADFDWYSKIIWSGAKHRKVSEPWVHDACGIVVLLHWPKSLGSKFKGIYKITQGENDNTILEMVKFGLQWSSYFGDIFGAKICVLETFLETLQPKSRNGEVWTAVMFLLWRHFWS